MSDVYRFIALFPNLLASTTSEFARRLGTNKALWSGVYARVRAMWIRKDVRASLADVLSTRTCAAARALPNLYTIPTPQYSDFPNSPRCY